MKSNQWVVLLTLSITSWGWSQNAPTTAPVAPPLSGKLGEPIQLFNGKDLEGWVWVRQGSATQPTDKPARMEDVWTVRNGILHDQGSPMGYLRTEKSFDNYVLTVEQRHVKAGNGGIFFAISQPDKVWPKAIEVQGQSGNEGHLRGVADFKLNLDPARSVPRQLNRIGGSVTHPVGEWDTVVITVDHGNVAVTINGQLKNLTSSPESFAGQVGLQAEGGEMEFRKFELRPIEPAK